MYKIEKKAYGYKVILAGIVDRNEIKQWRHESSELLKDAPLKFGVFVDMQSLTPLMPDAQKVLVEGQKMYAEKGIVRTVVILSNPILTTQFKRLAKESGAYKWERYINASENSNWEQLGEDWVIRDIDPDKIDVAKNVVSD